MKTIITYCFLLGMLISLQAQHDFSNSKKSIEQETNWLTFKTTEQTTASNLANNKALLQLAANDELSILSKKDDALGYRHYRYQQTYKGIPVEGAIYLMHEKNNKVQKANGKLVHQLDLAVKSAINEGTALQAALQYMDANLYAWDDPTHENNLKQVKNKADATFYPTGELVILDPEFKQNRENHRLAYKFDIYAVEPLMREVVYVDAQNGTVLKSLEKIHDCTNVSASGTTNYSGTVNFTACQDADGTYILKNNLGGGMQVFNSNNTTGNPQIPFTDTDNFFNGDPTANEVHWATQKTYEYFLNTHSRNSLDGEGMALLSWIHFGENYNNAFWNGSWMTYGDGDNNTFSSLTAPDVVAHEMAHGVTDFSADLIYSYESGALNESFSDIFGEVAENYMLGSNDWLMGADFTVKPGKTSLRNMSNPNDPNALTQQPDTYEGDFWWTSSGDNGGVHYNSGVQNYWFYLLCEGGSGTNDNEDYYEVSGIGMTKAASVAYLNLTSYLTPNSNYLDALEGSIAAAEALQDDGIFTATDVEQVIAAWCAVGVGNCGFNPPPSPCSSCNRLSDSLALVSLYNSTNGTNWTDTWNLNQSMNTWNGVQLNSSGCVDRLVLQNNNLNGSISPELGNLNCLTYLNLVSNKLSGNIPPELGNLAELTHLSLWINELSGSIPDELGNLVNLTHLSLSRNQLSGSIPTELGNLTNLIFLGLFENQLSGIIPIELGNLTKLIRLQLYKNQLTGNIPADLAELINLKELGIADNQITGNIPVGLGNLNSLIDFRLSNNNLSGVIPYELGNLTNVNVLLLDNNELSGSIPDVLGNLANLTILRLNNNQLSGCYVSNLINICAQLDPIYTLVSNGNSFNAPWEDFCLNGAGSCDGSAPKPVWSGDFNTDGITDIQDLLYWGSAEGSTGAERPNASFNWSAQDCPDWSLSVNGINSKHQDGDGDGTVNNNDLLALIQNYGNTHNYAPLTTVGGALAYRLELISSIPNANTNTITNTYDLFAESLTGVPVSTHGLACSIDFDGLPINSIDVDISNSALMPDESIDIYLDTQNRLDLALTRTDNNNQTLDGPVAKIVIGVEDFQVGDPFEIHVSNGSMMSANGNIVAVNNATFYGSFTGGPSIFSNLSVNVSAMHEGCSTTGSAMAQVTGGVAPYNYSWSTSASGNETTNLTSGIYSVTVSDAAGLSTSVFFQINGQTPIYDANGNLLCGSVCPDYLEPSGVTPDGLYNAAIKLESNAIIPEGDEVHFEAGQRIRLETGFKVKSGARFSAYIEECD